MCKLRAHQLSPESNGALKALQALWEENPQSELGGSSTRVHLVFSLASLVPSDAYRYHKVLSHGHLSKRGEGVKSPLVACQE